MLSFLFRCFSTAVVCAVSLGLMPAISPSFASEETRPEVAKYVKAYAGTEGARVWTLRYGSRNGDTALVQVSGVDHPLDGRILLTQVEKTDRDIRYSFDRSGSKFVLLILSHGGGNLYLPGPGDAIRLQYDEGASQGLNAEHLLTDYLNQEKQ